MASADTEVEFHPTNKPKRTGLAGKWEGTKEFFYNPADGTIVGRTGTSWAQIGIFYLIYYSCLAGFFAIMLATFFTTIDRNFPRLQDKNTPMKGNPGMGFRPMPDLRTTLVRFEQGKPESYKVFTDHIQSYLDQYENENQEGENFIDCSEASDQSQRDKDKVCTFQIANLGPECTWQKDYGYDEGQPCVLLKLNKIYGWEPETFDNDSIPETIGDRYIPGNVGITCEGENAADRENMGPITYYPDVGLPSYYFPYKNQEGYRQPVVMVQFNRPKNGVVIQIWCKAWSKNIKHHKYDKAGSIHFELLVD